ncbi:MULTISPECIES: DivIVA domain-containing protein [unclassified Nocardioides]|uniref:DivIVA domain-containing protein n=1 Tax=unclassified Nocardioides TaxID=2615069 RepID=UPI0007014432|nr:MULTISPECIES: DivIVA domain-containing protein [unclassified Nocardioides]KQY56282.1 hypothetical protein ASD30_07960 [Nocardioides sp. Root140]KRF10600.1 hypothetical protein ASH02_21160 [Nocardioides sp. Soil796]
MTWFFAILIVLALGGVALVASGYGQGLARVHPDRRDVTLPAGRDLVGGDLRRVRFTAAVRGYRMSEVDALLARLAAQLEENADARDGAEDGKATGT